MVSQYFSKEPVGDINPDEVVAVGAAIYGASLDQQLHAGPPPIPTDAQWTSAPTNMVSSPYAAQDATQGIASPYAAPLLLDVTPQALGVATAGGFCDILIARNENIPTERKRVFTTSKDQQDTVRLQIMEGDSKKSEENYKLGELVLTNLRPADRGDVSIEVTFEIDTNGILNVSATDKATRRTQRAQLNLSGAMGEEQIQALIARQRGIVMTDLPDGDPGAQP
jgi:molecular chaperone DnaK